MPSRLGAAAVIAGQHRLIAVQALRPRPARKQAYGMQFVAVSRCGNFVNETPTLAHGPLDAHPGEPPTASSPNSLIASSIDNFVSVRNRSPPQLRRAVARRDAPDRHTGIAPPDALSQRDFDEQTGSTALALICQHGVDAEVIAVMRAAEYAAVSEVEALAARDDILGCLSAIEAGEAGARPIQQRRNRRVARPGIAKETPLPVPARLFCLQHQNGTTRWTSPCC